MFENLTLAPIDKSLIELSILKKYEKFWINMYHKKVFNSLKSYMNFSELRDLKKLAQLSFNILFQSLSVTIFILRAFA